jgi:hypothetical protein
MVILGIGAKVTAEERFWQQWIRHDKEESRAQRQYKYGDPAKHVQFDREKKGGKMQRDIDEVQTLLDIWADWMRKPEPLTEGYPSKASGGFIESWRKDSEDLADAADAERVERINAAYDSLAPIYRDAIMRHYKLGSQVWRFAKDATFEDAKIMIRVKFVAKGLL